MKVICTTLVFYFMSLATYTWAENLLDKNMDQALANQVKGKASQQKVDTYYEEQRNALQGYRLVQAEIDQLKVYNRQLEKIISNQSLQMSSLNKQIKDIEATQRGIMPLMERMLLALDQFITLDVPFLLKERQQRIADLRVLLLDANTSVSEKFRRVLEAFQIEIEYGRTIEAYRADNEAGQTLDYLRVGRIGLYRMSLNGDNAEAWSTDNKAWSELPSSFNRDITKGLRIARKQASPELLNLAMPGVGE